MESLINNYTRWGINRDKIFVTKYPSVCKWSLSKKCIVGENDDDPLELLVDDNGTLVLSYKMIRVVPTRIHSEITPSDVIKINNSNGIIISCAVYGLPNYRYGFIPTI